jgi:hypothetical protein
MTKSIVIADLEGGGGAGGSPLLAFSPEIFEHIIKKKLNKTQDLRPIMAEIIC